MRFLFRGGGGERWKEGTGGVIDCEFTTKRGGGRQAGRQACMPGTSLESLGVISIEHEFDVASSSSFSSSSSSSSSIPPPLFCHSSMKGWGEGGGEGRKKKGGS